MAFPRSFAGARQTAAPQKTRAGRQIDSNQCCAGTAKTTVKRKILVIDVGGTHVKMMISAKKRRKFKSGPKMTPDEMVAQIEDELKGWKFDVVAIGFPAPVRNGRILIEPKHLGKGWVGFNFEKAFGKPVRILN